MKRPLIIIAILLLLASGIAAKSDAIPTEVGTVQCGCVALENGPADDLNANKAQSAIVRMVEL